MSNAARHDSSPPLAPASLRPKHLRRDSGSFEIVALEGERVKARGAGCSVVVTFITRAEFDRRSAIFNNLMANGWMVDGVKKDAPSNGELARRISRDEKCVRRLRGGGGRITDEMIDAMGRVGVELRRRLGEVGK